MRRTIPWMMLVMALAPACASSNMSMEAEKAPAPLSEEQTRLNLESFDMVWQTIKDQHYDETLGGLDWEFIGEELRPRVEEATTMVEARAPMQELIGKLGQSHFVIYPSDIYADAAASQDPEAVLEGDVRMQSHSGRPGTSGLEVRLLDDRVLVTGVFADSPAGQMGVHPGWEILSIGSVELAPRIEKLKNVLEGQTTAGLVISQSIIARLSGEEGDEISVLMSDAQGKEQALDWTLVPARGTPFTMGNLPEVRVWTETAILDEDIGYFRFNYFLDVMRVMGDYNQAMESFRDLPGVIIDLRGNPGGLGAMAMGMAGWFVDQRGLKLGTMVMRTGEFNFVINTRANGYNGHLAVLIDDLSASTSEIFAGGLRDLELAKLFGLPTAGAALPSNITRLPNGDGFQYAVANYFSENGDVLEGVGVEPHFLVVPNQKTLLKQGDPILKAAQDWLHRQPLKVEE